MDKQTGSTPPLEDLDLRALGSRLAGFRRSLHWSQRSLARQSGLNKDRISDLEAGAVEPRIGEVMRLSVALGKSLDELVYGRSANREPGDRVPHPKRAELYDLVIEGEPEGRGKGADKAS